MSNEQDKAATFHILPGKYTYHKRVGDCEVTITFQTVEELQSYLRGEQQWQFPLDRAADTKEEQ